MSDQAPTRREKMRLTRAYRRALYGGGFPNPGRAGCPGNEILKALASHKLDVSQVNDWVEHLGTCSPCFREFTELRKQVVWRRHAAYLSIAAAIIIAVLSFGWWKWRSGQPTVITAHNHIIADVRNRLLFRGGQGPGKGPLEFQRGFDDVLFYLPEGNRAGKYEVAIFHEEPVKPLVSATGAATIETDATTLKVTLDLSRIEPGYYLVGFRLRDTEWTYCPLIVK